MMTRRFLMMLLFALPFCSCSESYPEHPWEWEEEQEENPSIVQQGWVVVDNLGELPDYIKVYKSPDKLSGKKAIAYIAVADMSKAKFEVLGDIAYSEKAKGYGGSSVHTPSEFYMSSKAPVIINGGLFFYSKGFYYTQNMVIRDGKMSAPNQNYYSKDWVKFWHPTIGAFCQMKDGTFKTTWTYFTSDKINYCYPAPAENDIKKEPLPVPSASFPAGAEVLEATTAIGGIIVLLNKGEIKNTYVQEMLEVGATANHPRTAIGITPHKKMILFVCEGRNQTEGVAGLTTADVAIVMKNLGCIEALNLDGGGSSCMLVNGKETIKGSDGKQRKVLTAVGIR